MTNADLKITVDSSDARKAKDDLKALSLAASSASKSVNGLTSAMDKMAGIEKPISKTIPVVKNVGEVAKESSSAFEGLGNKAKIYSEKISSITTPLKKVSLSAKNVSDGFKALNENIAMSPTTSGLSKIDSAVKNSNNNVKSFKSVLLETSGTKTVFDYSSIYNAGDAFKTSKKYFKELNDSIKSNDGFKSLSLAVKNTTKDMNDLYSKKQAINEMVSGNIYSGNTQNNSFVSSLKSKDFGKYVNELTGVSNKATKSAKESASAFTTVQTASTSFVSSLKSREFGRYVNELTGVSNKATKSAKESAFAFEAAFEKGLGGAAHQNIEKTSNVMGTLSRKMTTADLNTRYFAYNLVNLGNVAISSRGNLVSLLSVVPDLITNFVLARSAITGLIKSYAPLILTVGAVSTVLYKAGSSMSAYSAKMKEINQMNALYGGGATSVVETFQKAGFDQSTALQASAIEMQSRLNEKGRDWATNVAVKYARATKQDLVPALQEIIKAMEGGQSGFDELIRKYNVAIPLSATMAEKFAAVAKKFDEVSKANAKINPLVESSATAAYEASKAWESFGVAIGGIDFKSAADGLSFLTSKISEFIGSGLAESITGIKLAFGGLKDLMSAPKPMVFPTGNVFRENAGAQGQESGELTSLSFEMSDVNSFFGESSTAYEQAVNKYKKSLDEQVLSQKYAASASYGMGDVFYNLRKQAYEQTQGLRSQAEEEGASFNSGLVEQQYEILLSGATQESIRQTSEQAKSLNMQADMSGARLLSQQQALQTKQVAQQNPLGVSKDYYTALQRVQKVERESAVLTLLSSKNAKIKEEQIKELIPVMRELGATEAEITSIIRQAEIDRLNSSREWYDGANAALLQYQEDASNYGKLASDAVTSGFDSMSSSLTDFVMGTENAGDSFEAFAKSVLNSMVNMVVQATVTANALKVMQGALSYFGLGSNSLIDVTGQGISGGNVSVVSGSYPFAKGGSFAGSSLSNHSNSVVSQPTMFRFASGVGLMGEAGSEAILPLKRSSDGTLGVKSSGSNNSNGVQAVSVNITNNSNQQVEATQSKSMTDAGQMVIDIVIDAVNRNKGGLRDVVQGAR